MIECFILTFLLDSYFFLYSSWFWMHYGFIIYKLLPIKFHSLLSYFLNIFSNIIIQFQQNMQSYQYLYSYSWKYDQWQIQHLLYLYHASNLSKNNFVTRYSFNQKIKEDFKILSKPFNGYSTYLFVKRKVADINRTRRLE
jgi:hypothetical protein